MKVVSIAGILPVPELIKENDIIYQIYDHLKKEYPNTDVEFIRTIPYANYFLSLIKDKWKSYYETIKKREYNDRGYNITVFPHLIFKSEENLYSLLTKITYYQNYFKIHKFADADIIHGHRLFSEGPLAYKMAQKLSKPYAITVRTGIRYFNGSYAERRAKRILDNASFITTPNGNTFSFLEKRYPEKSHLIPHGVSQKFFSEEIRSNSSPVRILTIAKFWEYKNIPTVIEALSELKNTYEFTYQIVGDGRQRSVIEQCIQHYEMEDYIEMNTHIPHDEIKDVYARSDIFVMVSYPETFGRVYFEAMAAGVPVICAKNSGVHGLFEEGTSGFSVDHKNIPELKSIISRLIGNKDLRRNVGKKGRELVRNYNWRSISDQYYALYSKAIKD
jgi:glycosyltransferase involved in cell wall biosynthesis